MLLSSSGADEVALPFIEIDRLADRSRRPGRVSACPENLGQLHQEVCAKVRHLSRHEANGFHPEIGRFRTRAARRGPRRCHSRERLSGNALRGRVVATQRRERLRPCRVTLQDNEREARGGLRWCRRRPARASSSASSNRRSAATTSPADSSTRAVERKNHHRRPPTHPFQYQLPRTVEKSPSIVDLAEHRAHRANRGPPGARDPRPRRAARTRVSPPEPESDRRPRPTLRVCERPLPLVVADLSAWARARRAACSISCISAARKYTYACT